jgi:type II secretory pathway pseudopilin PulG
MKFNSQSSDLCPATRGTKPRLPRSRSCHVSPAACPRSAFTLAEVLAAMVFMAIVIPVVIEALHIASSAGEGALEKTEAARVADNILNQNILTKLNNEPWEQDPIRLISVEVTYVVRDKNYSVRLCTLVDGSAAQSQTASTLP